MSAMGAIVGAMIGVSAGASVQEGKFIDPMTAFSALSDTLQGDSGRPPIQHGRYWAATYKVPQTANSGRLTKVITTMPFIGAVAGGYAGYKRMIPYVRDYVK